MNLTQLDARLFSTAGITPLDKDYYDILDIPSTATPEQIKNAYREQAKKYHPDVRMSETDGHEPDAQKFKEVAEAYSVLSVRESRVNYDLTRKKNPQVVDTVGDLQASMEARRAARDKSGNIPRDGPSRGSYAENRLEELKKEREKYNVNHLGYYRGGLPQKEKGPIRTKSLGRPGEFHDPKVHNTLENYHSDAHFVTSEDAIKFKWWMNSDIVDLKKTEPYYPMHYDKNFDFLRDRSFYFLLLLSGTIFIYAKKRYYVEKDRWRTYQRRMNLQDMPAHHFANRGGVLMEKEFVGFQKYYQNNEQVMDWYQKAYPHVFEGEEK